MVDKTIPDLDPVVTPAPTDRFGVRQAGDIEDKRETREQVHALEDGEYLVRSFTDNITASPTSTQVGATALTSQVNFITTCEDSGDSVRLPSTFPVGAIVEVHMRGTSDFCDVFPAVGDDLGEGVDTALLIAPNQQVRFIATVADSTWERVFQELIQSEAVNGALIRPNIGGGFNAPSLIPDKRFITVGIGGSDSVLHLVVNNANAGHFTAVSGGHFQNWDLENGVVANPGGGQGSAVLLRSSYSVVGTVATAGDSVLLPSVFLEGRLIYVKNDGANALDIFPAVGDDLGAGVDTAVSIAPGDVGRFISNVSNSTWVQDFYGHESLLLSEAPGALEATPTLAFGDGNTGFFESVDNVLNATVNGTARYQWVNDSFQGIQQTAPGLISDRSSSEPTLLPRFDDTNTGWGWGAADDMRAFAGSGNPNMIVGVDGKLFINTLTGTDETSSILYTTPGLVAIYGAGFSGNGQAGNVEIWGGYASGTTAAAVGGDLVLWGGSGGGGAAVGGNAFLIGGFGDSVAGDAIVRGGIPSVSGPGRDAIIVGGAAVGIAAVGGIASLTGGAGLLTGAGGQVDIAGGLAGATDASVGGAVNIAGGSSAATNGDGGDIVLTLGLATGSGAEGRVIIDPALGGTAARPALAFGDGNTGFYETADNDLFLATGGFDRFRFHSTGIRSTNSGGFLLNTDVPAFDDPNLIPAEDDTNTGIGHGEADNCTVVSGGVPFQLPELNGNVIQVPDAQIGLTAFATGGQASATQVNASYAQFSTVATLADSGRLPPVFKVGSIITVKNDGAADMDMFPSSGDDLGAGVDTAVSIVAGTAAKFLATVANSTWTQIGSSVAV